MPEEEDAHSNGHREREHAGENDRSMVLGPRSVLDKLEKCRAHTGHDIQAAEPEPEHEEHEGSIVAVAHALRHPRAVVVHFEHARTADRAVVRPLRLWAPAFLAKAAEAVSIVLFIGVLQARLRVRWRVLILRRSRTRRGQHR